jgi:hypothetical protein
MRIAIVGVVLGLTGCVFSTSDSDGALSDGARSADDVDQKIPGGVDRDDCKVEDAAVGVDDVAVPTPVGEVRVVSWTVKAGETGEYIGFELSRTARFVVKAGGETWAGEGASWTHPDGDSGPDVAAISHIDFCDDDGGGDDGGGDDGGGDDGGGDDGGGDDGGGDDGGGGDDCDDVDGCDGGGGGGELPPVD